MIFSLLQSNKRRRPPPLPAFPGAQGPGSLTTGGRGGQIVFVDNLNDSGAGSFRDAMLMTVPRIIIFRVSGTIELLSRLRPDSTHSNVTIAGQTAPGDGICIANYGFEFRNGFNNAIIRGLRIRPGTYEPDGTLLDCIEVGANCHDIIVDHCSCTWSVDESVSCWGADIYNVTFQWCILAESSITGHPSGDHSYGPLISGGNGIFNISIHHCYLSQHSLRVPKFSTGRVQFVNNIVYNNKNNTLLVQDYADGVFADVIGNYYRTGPLDVSLNHPIRMTANSPQGLPISLHLARNEAYTTTYTRRYDPADQTLFFTTYGTPPQYEIRGDEMPYRLNPIRTESPQLARERVMNGVGAFPRDAVDERVLDYFYSGTGEAGIGSAYPVLSSVAYPTDTDGDGMPDAWETANGLNPNSAVDASAIAQNKYTNIENYVNSLTFASSVTRSAQFVAANNSVLRILNASQVGLNPGTSDFAIAMFFNANSYTSRRNLFAKGASADGAGAAEGFQAYISTNGKITIKMGDSADITRIDVSGNAVITTGVWYFYVVNFDRDGNCAMYLNNALDKAGDMSGEAAACNPAAAFCIGASSPNSGALGNYFDGRIQYAGFWNRILSAGDMTELRNGGAGLRLWDMSPSLKAGNVSYWSMVETIAYRLDGVGNNNLTDVNSSVTTGTGL